MALVSFPIEQVLSLLDPSLPLVLTKLPHGMLAPYMLVRASLSNCIPSSMMDH